MNLFTEREVCDHCVKVAGSVRNIDGNVCLPTWVLSVFPDLTSSADCLFKSPGSPRPDSGRDFPLPVTHARSLPESFVFTDIGGRDLVATAPRLGDPRRRDRLSGDLDLCLQLRMRASVFWRRSISVIGRLCLSSRSACLFLTNSAVITFFCISTSGCRSK